MGRFNNSIASLLKTNNPLKQIEKDIYKNALSILAGSLGSITQQPNYGCSKGNNDTINELKQVIEKLEERNKELENRLYEMHNLMHTKEKETVASLKRKNQELTLKLRSVKGYLSYCIKNKKVPVK